MIKTATSKFFYYCSMGVLAMLVADCSREATESEVDIVNGAKINQTTYPAVIRIAASLQGGGFGVCSATWISTQTILTAAHCVYEGRNQPGKVSLYTSTGAGEKARAVHIHPQYSPFNGNGPDIAILEFSKNESRSYMALIQAQPKIGRQIRLVGFGKFDHRNSRSGGIKRQGSNKIIRIDGAGRLQIDGYVSPRSASGSGSRVVNSQGDSGGPMLIDNKVAGVSSSVNSLLTAEGLLRGNYESVRSSRVIPWIKGLQTRGVVIATDSNGTDNGTEPDRDDGDDDTPPFPGGNDGPVLPPPGNGGEDGSNTGVKLDCNRDYSKIRQSSQSGICINRSSNFCYRYSFGRIEYANGYVDCKNIGIQPSPSPAPDDGPDLSPRELLDCNRDFSTIRQGGNGICLNRSSGFCYSYGSRNVQYAFGSVACPI